MFIETARISTEISELRSVIFVWQFCCVDSTSLHWLTVQSGLPSAKIAKQNATMRSDVIRLWIYAKITKQC